MATSTDVVVVGAGVIGCAVAWELTRRGASVRVLDDRLPGMGATQASAGVLAPYIEARTGGALLDLTVRSLDMFESFVGRVRAESGLSVKYQRPGTLDVAHNDAAMQNLVALADLLAHRGVEARLLDASNVQSAEPQLAAGAIGGLLIPTHGFVAAGELTRALAAAVAARGGELLGEGRARRIGRDGAHLAVETDQRSFRASAVVLAAGSWSRSVEIEGASASLPVQPVRGQLLQLAWCGPPLKRVVWSEHCYVVPWGEGTVLVGATVEHAGFDERTTVDGVHGLLTAACRLLPAARSAIFVAARAGLRPGTPDELPIIGRSAVLPGLMYATGHYRNGILLAPLTAQLVADAVLDDAADPLLDLTRPGRFGPL